MKVDFNMSTQFDTARKEIADTAINSLIQHDLVMNFLDLY